MCFIYILLMLCLFTRNIIICYTIIYICNYTLLGERRIINGKKKWRTITYIITLG